MNPLAQKHLYLNIVQSDIVNSDPRANIDKCFSLISKAEQQPDLWVFPETFVTGFASIYPEMAQNEDGEVFQWLKDTAKEYSTAICAGMLVEEDGKIYNAMYLVESSGVVQRYRKRHLFSYGYEQRYISAADDRSDWEFKGWKIRPCLCYDLRFPVWLRNDSDYELLLCLANWPDSRIFAWDSLLTARAIENMCYVVGVNRTGEDSLGSLHTGHSEALTPVGKSLVGAKVEEETVLNIRLSYDRVHSVREKYGFLSDRDSFVIE